MTAGRGRFGAFNLALLLAAVLGGGLFVLAEARAASPLIRLAVFRNAPLNASLAMNALVSTVMMATLVVGPFYLSRGLRLNEALVGIVMSIGPIISALSGVPAGRIVDRLGAPLMVVVGLIEITAGSAALSVLPTMFGVAGYVAAVAMGARSPGLVRGGRTLAIRPRLIAVDVTGARRSSRTQCRSPSPVPRTETAS